MQNTGSKPSHWRRWDVLTENRFVHLFVESDNQFLSNPQRGGSQIASWAKNQFEHFLLGWFVFLQVQFDNLLAFGDQQVIDQLQDFDRISFLMRFLFRVDFSFGFDIGGRKKLLRFNTSLSAFTVVAPIECWHLIFLPDVVLRLRCREQVELSNVDRAGLVRTQM